MSTHEENIPCLKMSEVSDEEGPYSAKAFPCFIVENPLEHPPRKTEEKGHFAKRVAAHEILNNRVVHWEMEEEMEVARSRAFTRPQRNPLVLMERVDG